MKQDNEHNPLVMTVQVHRTPDNNMAVSIVNEDAELLDVMRALNASIRICQQRRGLLEKEHGVSSKNIPAEGLYQPGATAH